MLVPSISQATSFTLNDTMLHSALLASISSSLHEANSTALPNSATIILLK